MNKKNIINEILRKICEDNVFYGDNYYEDIQQFLLLLDDEIIKRIYCYICLKF